MRFGISATSWIFPKNFLTRFRPINVCAIMSSRSIDPSGKSCHHAQAITLGPTGPASRSSRYRGDQGDSPKGRNPSRPSGQASHALFSSDSAKCPNHAPYSPLPGDISDSRAVALKSQKFLRGPQGATAPPGRGWLLSKHSLLKLNLCTNLFEGRLDLGSLVLVDAFLDRLWRAFDQVLGLSQAQPGKGANLLDDLDLLIADSGKNDRKLGLFLGRGCRGGRGTGSNRNRGGGRDAPLLFEQLGELRGLENGKTGEVVDDFLQISHELCPSVRTFELSRLRRQPPLPRSCWRRPQRHGRPRRQGR